MRTYVYIGLALLVCGIGCKSSAPSPTPCEFSDTKATASIEGNFAGGLLASRLSSLEALRAVVDIEYSNGGTDKSSIVRLRHCSKGVQVISELRSGLSQKDIVKARDGGLQDRLGLLLQSPYTIARRGEFQQVYMLSRWVPAVFGEGDVAFYNLAKAAVQHINTPELAFKAARDSSSKGYINTFNHFTAQTIVTSCFSEELADFIADIHELHNMPELTHGNFSKDQLTNPNNNPVDNYVDMINNEWGQEIGKQLRKEYHITRDTYWTPALLTNYLNDIQHHFSWTFGIGFQPFREEDEVIVRFAHKMNVALRGGA